METSGPHRSPSVKSRDGRRVAVPKACALDGFVEIASKSCGVTLGDVEPLRSLEVRTENSVYRMTVLEPRRGQILIQGGRRWPEPTKGRLLGSSFGGSFIKLGSIICGMRMELQVGGRRVVTSPVRQIEIEQDTALHGPF